jgi:hypothetical protein
MLKEMKAIELRRKWPNEASQMTPDIAGHRSFDLDKLLGLDLVRKTTEKKSGLNGRADIVAYDTLTNNTVIIENMLGNLDASHFTRGLKYADGNKAQIIVYICNTVPEDTKRLIYSLNTSHRYHIFAVEIKCFEINNTIEIFPYLICRPDAWALQETFESRVKRLITRPEIRNLAIETRDCLLAFSEGRENPVHNGMTYRNLEINTVALYFQRDAIRLSVTIGENKMKIPLNGTPERRNANYTSLWLRTKEDLHACLPYLEEAFKKAR